MTATTQRTCTRPAQHGTARSFRSAQFSTAQHSTALLSAQSVLDQHTWLVFTPPAPFLQTLEEEMVRVQAQLANLRRNSFYAIDHSIM